MPLALVPILAGLDLQQETTTKDFLFQMKFNTESTIPFIKNSMERFHSVLKGKGIAKNNNKSERFSVQQNVGKT